MMAVPNLLPDHLRIVGKSKFWILACFPWLLFIERLFSEATLKSWRGCSIKANASISSRITRLLRIHWASPVPALQSIMGIWPLSVQSLFSFTLSLCWSWHVSSPGSSIMVSKEVMFYTVNDSWFVFFMAFVCAFSSCRRRLQQFTGGRPWEVHRYDQNCFFAGSRIKLFGVFNPIDEERLEVRKVVGEALEANFTELEDLANKKAEADEASKKTDADESSNKEDGKGISFELG